MTWADVAWMRSVLPLRTSLILKGVMTAEDAALARARPPRERE